MDYNKKYRFIGNENCWWKNGAEIECESLWANDSELQKTMNERELTLEELNLHKSKIAGEFRGLRIVDGEMKWEEQLGYKIGYEYEKGDIGSLIEFDIFEREEQIPQEVIA